MTLANVVIFLGWTCITSVLDTNVSGELNYVGLGGLVNKNKPAENLQKSGKTRRESRWSDQFDGVKVDKADPMQIMG